MWESKNEKLLGIIIDKNVDFKEYIHSVCLKAGSKVTVLGRMSKYLMSISEKAYFESLYTRYLHTVQLCGCFMIEMLNIKLIVCMKGFYVLYIKPRSKGKNIGGQDVPHNIFFGDIVP